VVKPVIFVFQYEVSLLLAWTASYSKQLSNDDFFPPAVVFVFRQVPFLLALLFLLQVLGTTVRYG